MFNPNINACRFQREKKSNIVMKHFFKVNEKHFNYDIIKFPVKKGIYLTRNAQKSPDLMVDSPGFIPLEEEGKFETVISGGINRKRYILCSGTEIIKNC